MHPQPSVVLSLWKGLIDRGSPCMGRDEMHAIVADVAKRFNTTVPDIMGNSRFKEHVRARSRAMAEMHTTERASYSSIARFFKKDHTTCLAAVRRTPLS